MWEVLLRAGGAMGYRLSAALRTALPSSLILVIFLDYPGRRSLLSMYHHFLAKLAQNVVASMQSHMSPYKPSLFSRCTTYTFRQNQTRSKDDEQSIYLCRSGIRAVGLRLRTEHIRAFQPAHSSPFPTPFSRLPSPSHTPYYDY